MGGRVLNLSLRSFSGEAELGHLAFRIIDTAGLEQAEPGTLSDRMQQQTETAIDEADLILFLIDARAGILPADHKGGRKAAA